MCKTTKIKDKYMKMVFVGYLHGFGGAEKQIIMLANEMVERGHDVFLLSLVAGNICYDMDKRVKHRFIQDKKMLGGAIFSRYLLLLKQLKEIKPDITINFWFQSAYLEALMPRGITGKVIYCERSDPGDKQFSGVLRIIRTITMPLMSGFVFQSKGAQNFFNRRIVKKSVIIPNAVILKESSYEHPPKKDLIINVGRLSAQKNQSLLIQAFSSITKEFPNYKLEIFGEGELKNQLDLQIKSLKMTEYIEIKKPTLEIQKIMRTARLFVLSSDYEGMPNTLLEAMALGTPCISTDCKPGGAREIINNGENGFIVERRNVEQLTKAIEKVLINPELQQQFIKKGLRKMENFEPRIIYDKWEDYFVKVKNS